MIEHTPCNEVAPIISHFQNLKQEAFFRVVIPVEEGAREGNGVLSCSSTVVVK